MGLAPENWVGIFINAFSFIFSGVCAVATVVWQLAQHEKKIQDEMKDMLRIQDERHDAKVARVYTRFDEYKAFIENQFVRKDLCSVMHNNTANAVLGLNERIDGIEKKIDELKDIIINGIRK